MWKPLALIILMMLIGTIGFHVIEGWSFLDCLYMTVITIFTVGFKEVRELSPQGQIFTIFVILGGVGTAIFAFTKIAEIAFEGELINFGGEEEWKKSLKT